MKRLLILATFLLLLGLTTSSIATAQDATPAAGGMQSTDLLDALGYPALEIAYDGTNVTAPATLVAGRYNLDFSNTGGSTPALVTFLGATPDISTDDILAQLQNADLSQGPPPIVFQVKITGPGEPGVPGVMTFTAGDWLALVVGDNGPAFTKFTVTGDLPTYDDIADAVHVDLHEMVIDMPDTVPAGDHLWQITNTGSMPHMLVVEKAPGPVTDADVMAMLGASDSTPAASPENGSAGDQGDAGEIPAIQTGIFSNGLTQLAEANLEPGTYVAFCFVEGPGDVGLHAMAGMYKIFTVE